jgi:hypothetical protein
MAGTTGNVLFTTENWVEEEKSPQGHSFRVRQIVGWVRYVANGFQIESGNQLGSCRSHGTVIAAQ